MVAVKPYSTGIFETIVGVHWASGEAIALFGPDQWDGAGALFPGSVEILKGANNQPKVTSLGTGTSKYQAGAEPSTIYAYKVKSNSGTFANVTLGFKPPEGHGNSFGAVYMSLWAIDPDIGLDASLKRAFAGHQLMVVNWYCGVAPYFAFIVGGSNLPSQADPPGLLWSGLSYQGPGETLPFKVRYDVHRGGASNVGQIESIPNKMWQLYPLGTPRVIGSGLNTQEMDGYVVGMYRLDKKGTGQTYGIPPPQTFIDSPDPGLNVYPGGYGALLDPAWQVTLSPGDPFGSLLGILYGDPPPLISADNPSQDGGVYPPFNVDRAFP